MTRAARISVLLATMLAATVTAGLGAAAAQASIGPVSITLSPTSGTAASTANLATDIKFSPSGGDSTKDLTLQLPAGLLANAGIDGGACLRTTTPIPACQVGSGTVTAALGGALPVTLNATFDLVAPPSPADLAGLAALVTPPLSQPMQLGSAAAITVRPLSSPLGGGLDIAFTNVPNTFDGASISLQEINSTFNSLRFPSTCPATPATFNVSADSYSTSTPVSAHAPLRVTGCSTAPFAPRFSVTAIRDASDAEVTLTTQITQTAAELTSGSVSLAFPPSVLSPNLNVVQALCANPASGTCTPVGSASATSPLYPHVLMGQAFLTGAVFTPSLTLIFPAPFALTLSGAVNLGTNSTTFSGLPDIPLSDLGVTLFGGPHGAFEVDCAAPSGTATATLTTQNGDRTVTVPTAFTVSGCSGGSPTVLTTPGGATGRRGRPRISSASLSGLAAGRPSLSFALVAGRKAPKLRAFAVKLGSGLHFAARRAHGHLTVPGVRIAGARAASISLIGGRLVVRLRRAVRTVSVTIGPPGLLETAALRHRAQLARIRRLVIDVFVTDATGRNFKLVMAARSVRGSS